MAALTLTGLAALLLWSLVSHRFERWGVPGPVVLIVLGAVTTVWDLSAYAAVIDSPSSEKVVEVILAIILFVDATEVQGGIFGRDPRVILRLVLIGPADIVDPCGAGQLHTHSRIVRADCGDRMRDHADGFRASLANPPPRPSSGPDERYSECRERIQRRIGLAAVRHGPTDRGRGCHRDACDTGR